MFSLKKFIAPDKTALAFLSKLFFLLFVLKIIFFLYNYNISGGWQVQDFANAWNIIKWSVIYDAASIALINFPLLLLFLIAVKSFRYYIVRTILIVLFTLLNTFVIVLNSIDIFYYRFHMQRADADLLYVLRNPLSNGTLNVIVIGLIIIFFSGLTGWYIYKSISRLMQAGLSQHRFLFTNGVLMLFILLFFLSGTKKLLPTFALTQLQSVQLPLAQNSMHSFIYSMYRKNESIIPNVNYMPAAQQASLFSIYKKNNTESVSPKNIVLFIMESVPAEFFDSSSAYKVAMPFLDSLLKKSTYFSNAFSYSYSSNKGITAILAGIPTITDIPLYHSNYTSITRTSVGSELAKKNYTSSFFIGDNYDDFGFAKCCKWLGIQHYYCMQDIPGYKKMEKHSLGLHDEDVLNFMQQKLSKMQQPFFSVQYNISTHYPNDLPKKWIDKYPDINKTPPMKTMKYYSDCLQQFFTEAAKQAWYNNTVFIFCSDHWAQPNTNTIKVDELESFRIPIFIYDPSRERKVIISSPVSQLDIMNTILHYGGANDNIISYGVSLADTALRYNRPVFTKINSAIYEAINNEYVLGFNAIEGKPIYCYAYKNDTGKIYNLLKQTSEHSPAIDSIILQMKAFLQTASRHYRNRSTILKNDN